MTAPPVPSDSADVADGSAFGSPPTDPLRLLQGWLAAAEGAGVLDPFTWTLATVNRDGEPSTRSIALQECDERGLVFFTNLTSRKGRDLSANPRAAATVYWREAMRQVNVAGRVEFTDDTESDRMWAARGPAGQIASLVSNQGEPLSDEPRLRRRAATLAQQAAPLPRPPGHGGFVLVPDAVEFWLGSPDRLHRRLHYSRTPSGWTHWRLQP